MSGDEEGWAWLKDKARLQGALGSNAAPKPRGAPPPLPGNPLARVGRSTRAPPRAPTCSPRAPACSRAPAAGAVRRRLGAGRTACRAHGV